MEVVPPGCTLVETESFVLLANAQHWYFAHSINSVAGKESTCKAISIRQYHSPRTVSQCWSDVADAAVLTGCYWCRSADRMLLMPQCWSDVADAAVLTGCCWCRSADWMLLMPQCWPDVADAAVLTGCCWCRSADGLRLAVRLQPLSPSSATGAAGGPNRRGRTGPGAAASRRPQVLEHRSTPDEHVTGARQMGRQGVPRRGYARRSPDIWNLLYIDGRKNECFGV